MSTTVTTTDVERTPQITVRTVCYGEGVSTGACFSMGLDTHKVPMKLHAENRAKLLARFKGAPSQSVILMEGGQQEYRNGTDHEPVFRQESFFQYLFGVMEPGCYGALDIDTGKSILFIPRLPDEWRVWMGCIESAESFKERYEVDEVRYVDEIKTVLQDQYKAKLLYVNEGKNSDSGLMHKPACFPGMDDFEVDKSKLFEEIADCRVVKSNMELDVLRYTTLISSRAHLEVMRAIKPGMKEYQLASLFHHSVYSKGGCRHLGYTCICGSGLNAATLHYGHAGAPNDKTIEDGDLCLFDMGGEYHCYGADITCSYPANGKFTQKQKDVYECVLAAWKAVMNAIKPGVTYPDMHILSYRALLEEMKQREFVVGDVDEMMKVHLASYFMPHGLGHLIGLDTHDVGGYPAGMERSTLPGLKSLRTGRTLVENMVLTVEPGMYFIDILLDRAFADPEVAKFLNKEKIEQFRGFGGVRIEDDVVVTADGVENMTKCPRDVKDIEAVMAGQPWAPAGEVAE